MHGSSKLLVAGNMPHIRLYDLNKIEAAAQQSKVPQPRRGIPGRGSEKLPRTFAEPPCEFSVSMSARFMLRFGGGSTKEMLLRSLFRAPARSELGGLSITLSS